MNFPFTPWELVGGATLLASAAMGYADLRARVKSNKEQSDERHLTLTGRVAELELDMADMKSQTIAVAMLTRSVESLDRTAQSMASEAAASRAAMEKMGNAIVRIETKMDMEDGAPRPRR